jgi:hypothetical protein
MSHMGRDFEPMREPQKTWLMHHFTRTCNVRDSTDEAPHLKNARFTCTFIGKGCKFLASMNTLLLKWILEASFKPAVVYAGAALNCWGFFCSLEALEPRWVYTQ